MKTLLALLFLLGVLSRGGVARADATEDLSRAIELYGRLEYDSATELFQKIADDGESTPRQRATASVYLAMIHQTLGEEAKAQAAFERAVDLDATVPAPDGASPKVGQILEDLRRRYAPQPKRVDSSLWSQPLAPWKIVSLTGGGLGVSGIVGGIAALGLSGNQPAGSPRGNEYSSTGVGLLVAGSVVVAAGVVVWLVTGRTPEAKPDATAGAVAF